MELEKFASLLAGIALVVAAGSLSAQQPRQTPVVDVFVGGVEYPNFRTPTLVKAQNGTLIALAEGRTGDEPGFGGDSDLVMKRSFDGGATWTPLQVIENPAAFGEKVSNNTAVVDQSNGRVWVLYNRWEGNLGTVDSLPGTTNNTAWARFSDNSGATWSSAIDITMGVKDFNNWNSMAFGPGSGIQASGGRLIIPAARWVGSWSSYAVYSDDNGANWQRGTLTTVSNLSSENEVVELANGDIMMDARQNSAGAGPRVKYFSSDGGQTWPNFPLPGQWVESVHTAIERLSLQSAGDDMNRIVWTGPRGPDRYDLVVRTSYNEGSTYTNERLLYDGYSGYSDIEILPDGNVGVFWETNQARSLSFTTFNLQMIEPPAGLLAYDGFRYATPAILGNKNGGIGFSGGWAGNADLTGVANSIIEASDLHYTALPFVTEGNGRPVFFNFAGGSMARQFETPLDLDTDQPFYFSLLIRQDTDGVDQEDATEALDVALLSGTTPIAGFGVEGDEGLYVENGGIRVSTAADTISKDTVYYLVGKLVAQDGSSGGNFDQLFLSAFASGDPVPATEAQMTWTLAGGTASNSSALIDRLMISGGDRATWVLDELRVGTRFGDVVSNLTLLFGDANNDGVVTSDDLIAVQQNFGATGPADGTLLGDANDDGTVTADDLVAVQQNFGNSLAPAGAPIPEPSTVALIGLCVLAGPRRRRVRPPSRPRSAHAPAAAVA